MITAIEKGVNEAKATRPPAGVYGDIDLRVLPRFVSFKAALLREKMGYQYLLALAVFISLGMFLIQNNRLDYWQSRYREKEFILVPSNIVGHTPAVPQSVPKSYVTNGVTFFVWLLGNTTPTDIDEKYERFAAYMTPDLRARFLSETVSWRDTVRRESIYEQVEIVKKDWSSKVPGEFEVEVGIRRDRRVNGDFMGTSQETIKMKMALIPPQEDREWIFEIKEFSRRPVGAN